MTEVLNGLQGLETFLSQLFQVDPDSCVKRVEAMRRLPRLDASRPAQPNYSIWQIASARGKRISKVEFGCQEPVEGCHDREMFVLHFDDDSMLAVTTGSNAMDVSSKFEGLEPSDFHVDFVLTEVPTLKSK